MPSETTDSVILISVTLALTALAVAFPAIYGDAATYAVISKNMAVSGDWVNLTFMDQDWLDKPHFPFWMTALSFKIFGVNAPAYLLPGVVFHAIGAWFTYRLAAHFYDRATGLVAALISLTAVRLLWSTVDLRAEAYLTAQIVAALYFWVRYDETPRPKYLIAGAAFTGMALMTKGLFVLGAIFGGLLFDLLRRGDWRRIVSAKWLSAAALSFVFTLPELIALYLQFDLHPEKIVFGQTGVSGVRFFFWDSQFGRLFNTGPIQASGNDPFFFVHTFLWAFLPWTFLFIGALVLFLRRRRQLPQSEMRPFVVLSISFLIPFFFFSVTTFQLDHYLDIVLPFAAILSARFFIHHVPQLASSIRIYRLQLGTAVLVTAIAAGLSLVAFSGSPYIWMTAVPVAVLAAAATRYRAAVMWNGVILSVLAANAAFVVLALANWMYFERYDAAYRMARILEHQPTLPVYDYGTDSKTLAFYATQRYATLVDLATIHASPGDRFILASDPELDQVMQAFPNARVIAHENGIASNRLAVRLMNVKFGRRADSRTLNLIRTGG